MKDNYIKTSFKKCSKLKYFSITAYLLAYGLKYGSLILCVKDYYGVNNKGEASIKELLKKKNGLKFLKNIFF